jgi:hypothetical protein
MDCHDAIKTSTRKKVREGTFVVEQDTTYLIIVQRTINTLENTFLEVVHGIKEDLDEMRKKPSILLEVE